MVNIEGLMRLEGVSSITPADEALFRMMVAQHRPAGNCRFEDSWAYILQATRNLPMKFVAQDALVLLTIKDDQSAVVIPNYFVPDNQALVDIVDRVRTCSAVPVILKNVPVGEMQELQQRGFSHYLPGEEWHSTASHDDQTFSQRIVEVQRVLKKQGTAYATLRQQLNGFEREDHQLFSRAYDPIKDREQVLRLCSLQEQRVPGTIASHKPFLDFGAHVVITPYVFEINGELVGYILLDHISDQCAAYNALIYDSTYRFLSRKLTYEAFQIAAAQGYPLLNLQGSETTTLDRWKRQWRPIQSVENTHLIYRELPS